MSPLTPIRISSIRCSWSMVLALTDTGEALHWGHCSGGTVISSPRRVEGCRFPREVFARGYYPDSGGTVYLGRTILYETILFVHNSCFTWWCVWKVTQMSFSPCLHISRIETLTAMNNMIIPLIALKWSVWWQLFSLLTFSLRL